MKKLTRVLALAITAFSATFAHAGSPNVVGNWNVTFFLEVGRTTGATQCISFIQVPGTVGGVSTSGVWTSPTFPGWSGQWVQLGDHVRFFGVTSALATEASGNLESNTLFGGVSFNHFFKTDAMTSSSGSWTAVRVPTCRLGTVPYSGDDPAKGALLN
jgi:hypothetical protein